MEKVTMDAEKLPWTTQKSYPGQGKKGPYACLWSTVASYEKLEPGVYVRLWKKVENKIWPFCLTNEKVVVDIWVAINVWGNFFASPQLNRSKTFLRKMGLTKADNVKIWPNTTLFDNSMGFWAFSDQFAKKIFSK